jgi:hypothetical protein
MYSRSTSHRRSMNSLEAPVEYPCEISRRLNHCQLAARVQCPNELLTIDVRFSIHWPRWLWMTYDSLYSQTMNLAGCEKATYFQKTKNIWFTWEDHGDNQRKLSRFWRNRHLSISTHISCKPVYRTRCAINSRNLLEPNERHIVTRADNARADTGVYKIAISSQLDDAQFDDAWPERKYLTPLLLKCKLSKVNVLECRYRIRKMAKNPVTPRKSPRKASDPK